MRQLFRGVDGVHFAAHDIVRQLAIGLTDLDHYTKEEQMDTFRRLTFV
jgi:hypothetical protein